MPLERNADPEVTQALNEVEKALRQELSALGTLPREHAELKARLERLQAEREELHRELEGLRQGRPSDQPWLPAALTPPFDLQLPRHSPLRLLRDLSPSLILASCALLMEWTPKSLFFVGLALLGALVLSSVTLADWLRGPRWRFGESTLVRRDRGEWVPPQAYAEVLEVEVHATPSQRKRGLGDVVLKCARGAMNPAGKSLTLRNMPEPERLARWLHERRGPKE